MSMPMMFSQVVMPTPMKKMAMATSTGPILPKTLSMPICVKAGKFGSA